MKQIVLSNWNFMRLFTLCLGILIIIQSVGTKEWSIVFMGVLFTLMPIFNIGCCGVGGCATPRLKQKKPITKNSTYEEVV